MRAPRRLVLRRAFTYEHKRLSAMADREKKIMELLFLNDDIDAEM